MQSNRTTQASTNTKRLDHMELRTAAKKYSYYQDWRDIVTTVVICIFAMLIAMSITIILYLLLISPHPTINLFSIIQNTLQTIVTWVLKVLRFLYFIVYHR
jgi:ABC-type amino acid transport system permease subunit